MASAEEEKRVSKLSDRLKKLAETNETAERLYSAWITDKENIKQVINVVSAPYTVFSDHGESHSKGIISAIELLLGEDRINALGYTDIWLILECAYRHDIGMHISNKEILDLIDKPEFEKFMDNLKQTANEETLIAVENLNNFKIKHTYNETRRQNLREIDGLHADLNTVLLEYYRPKHGERSEEIITNEDHKLYFIPDRMWTIIGSICKGHYENIGDCLGRLSHHEKGIDNDIAHPKFVQMLLRIGDLLDIDNNRFNTSQLELVNEDKISVFTKGEILKHKSVHSLYISPKKIQLYFAITLERSCDNAKRDKTIMAACNAIASLRKYLRSDLKEFAEKWSQIAPDALSGSVPAECDFKLTLDGTITDPDELSLKYTFNHKRASDIIQGTSLYRTPLDIIESLNTYRPLNMTKHNKRLKVNWVFLREFLQNAFDATKIQFFDNLCHYEKEVLFFGCSRLNKSLLTTDFILHGNENLPQCDLLTKEQKNFRKYENKYQYEINNSAVELNIECAYPEDKTVKSKCCKEQDKKGNDGYNFIIKIRDRGLGIDKTTLKSMKNIGNESVVFENRDIPSWLQPTASFGIGMQSAFELVNEFSATSFAKSDNKIRRIIFKSAANGGEDFSYETGNKDYEWYGTEFTFVIPASKIAEQYGVRFISKERVFYDIEKYIKKTIKRDIFPLKVTFKDSINSSNSCKHRNYSHRFMISSIFDKIYFSKLYENNLAEETPDPYKDVYFHPYYEPKDGSFTVLKISNKQICKHLEQRDGIKINYRGIEVESCIKTLMYSDIEAYVWGGKASEILKINREEFLAEGMGYVLDKVNKAFIDFTIYVTHGKKLNDISYPSYISKDLQSIIEHLAFTKKGTVSASAMSNDTNPLSIPFINLVRDGSVFRPTEIMKHSINYILSNWQNIWFTSYPLELFNRVDTIEILGMDEDIFLVENVFHDIAKGYNEKINTNKMFIGKNGERYFTAYRYGFEDRCIHQINEDEGDQTKAYERYIKTEISNYFMGGKYSANYWAKPFDSLRSYVNYAIPPLESWRKAYDDLLLEMSEERSFDTPSGADLSMHYLVTVIESDYKIEFEEQREKCMKFCPDNILDVALSAFVDRLINTDYCKELLTFISQQNKKGYMIVKDKYGKYLSEFYKMLLNEV
jgi:hypothetical protein